MKIERQIIILTHVRVQNYNNFIFYIDGIKTEETGSKMDESSKIAYV